MSAATLALLLLGDGRLPSGGHAHSAGVEAAVVDGRITDLATLEAYVTGRLLTVGLVEASFAAAAALSHAPLTELDAELDVRIVAAPLRASSRRLGRQLARVAGRCWPHPSLAALVDTFGDGAHQPIALGVAGIAAGIDAAGVALLAVHHAVTTPAQAAVRLLGLDPFAVAALTADLASVASGVAAEAVAAAHGPAVDLPALSAPVLDIAAVEHAARDARMFAT